VIRIDNERIQDPLCRIVGGLFEHLQNTLLDAEADRPNVRYKTLQAEGGTLGTRARMNASDIRVLARRR